MPVNLPLDLGWQENTDIDSGGGYYIYVGSSPEDYGSRIDVGNVTTYPMEESDLITATMPYPVLGETYYLALSAYGKDDNESEKCDPIVVQIVGIIDDPLVIEPENICDELVIEAEDMSDHANGRQDGDFWNLWGNGTMSEEVNFSYTDTYRFEIIAKGDLAYGVGPEMELIIDGITLDTVFVNNTTPETFIFDAYVTAGNHLVAIGFYNDYYAPEEGIDRNLYVDKMIISSLSCFALDEICDNGIDDDGDGTTDCEDTDCEGYVIVQTTCGIGVCSRVGELMCSGGIEVDTCLPGTPTGDDTDCNGLDDDCSGFPDDGYVPADTTCGEGVCASDGQLVCEAGVELDTCVPDDPIGPDNNCNGLDEDCDGMPDDGYEPTDTSCGEGVCASDGQLICEDGMEVDTCLQGDPTEDPEASCEDRLDNDCDGLIDCQDPDCDHPCECDELVIEAEEMSYHRNGIQKGEYWKLWGDGEMTEEVNFSDTDVYRFEIIAKGDLVDGVGPEMELMIDWIIMDTVFVNNTTPETFIFDVYVTAGDHTLAIGFHNDYYDLESGTDRNLYVDKTIIILSSCRSD